MGDDDAELMARALDLLDRAYAEGRHEVVAAMRTADGAVHLGVHVDGSARRSSVCAEGAAASGVVAHRASGGSGELIAAVSVLRRPGGSTHVIEPCGVCAELITDYWPEARVWVTQGDETVAVAARELLPVKRTRRW